MHKKSSYWFILCVFTATVALLVGCLFIPDPQAEEIYQEITGEIQKKTCLTHAHLQQSKKGVVKEILFNDGNDLRKVRLECREAEILFVEREGKKEIVEKMYDVIGRVQEKLYTRNNLPRQTVCYFEADSAIYAFKSGCLTAEQTSFSRYNLPTQILLTPLLEVQPEMTGLATQVELSLKDQTLKLSAQDFKGRFES